MKNKITRTKEGAVNKEKGSFEQLELFPGWKSEQEGSSKEQEKAEEAEIAALGQLPLNDRFETKRRHFYVKASDGRHVSEATKSVLSNIKSVAKIITDKYPPSPRTVRRWQQRFAASGESTPSPAPLLKMKGNRSRRISAEVRSIINLIQKKFLVCRPRYPAAFIYKVVLRRIMQENEGKDERSKLAFPSYTTICRMQRQIMDYIKANIRHSKRSAYELPSTLKEGVCSKGRKTKHGSWDDVKRGTIVQIERQKRRTGNVEAKKSR